LRALKYKEQNKKDDYDSDYSSYYSMDYMCLPLLTCYDYVTTAVSWMKKILGSFEPLDPLMGSFPPGVFIPSEKV
jgi:hypothetical protein